MFCRQVATELKMPRRHVGPQALEQLRQYQFPGNLRELKNLIERAYILTNNLEIGIEDLPVLQHADLAPTNGKHGKLSEHALKLTVADSFDLTELLERTEKELIQQTLSSTRGAQAEAARRMGLSRSALAYKLNKYGIRTAGE